MDVQVGDNLTFFYKRDSSSTRHGTVTKIHSNGRFSVSREHGHCLNFRADGSHERYTILSIERSDKPREVIYERSESDLVIARKKLFESLSSEQQTDLVTSATDCFARSSNHSSIEQALNEMIDLLLNLRG